PVFTYPHSGSGSLGRCIIGGSFAGAAFGALAGQYVFGDCTSSTVYLATVNGTRDGTVGTPSVVATSADTPSDFVTGPDGAIYCVALGGDVRRLAVSLPGGEQLLGGRKLALRLNPDPTRNALRMRSVLGPVTLGGTDDDPTQHGGSLRVRG